MQRLILAAFFVLGLAQCSNQEAVDAATAMADAICACKKLACAQEMTAKHNERISQFRDARGTDDDSDQIKAAGERARGCIARLTNDEKK